VLRVWWAALHALLLAAALATPAPASLTGVLAGAVLLHGAVRYPRAARPLIVYIAAGIWALPTTGRFDLRLTAATAVGPGWVSLHFPGNRPLLLLADQFTPDAWRRLRAAVGESLRLVPGGRDPI